VRISLVFCGSLATLVGNDQREIVLAQGPARLCSILAALERTDPELVAALSRRRARLALNDRLVSSSEDPLVCDGDELLLLPAIAGG
jgi:molybdopterin converting factor small subunit